MSPFPMEEAPMDQGTNRRVRAAVVRVGVALLAGLVVLVLLFPAHGIDPIPPQCFSLIGYTVPCEDGLALAAGATTAGVVGLLLWLRGRSR